MQKDLSDIGSGTNIEEKRPNDGHANLDILVLQKPNTSINDSVSLLSVLSFGELCG